MDTRSTMPKLYIQNDTEYDIFIMFQDHSGRMAVIPPNASVGLQLNPGNRLRIGIMLKVIHDRKIRFKEVLKILKTSRPYGRIWVRVPRRKDAEVDITFDGNLVPYHRTIGNNQIISIGYEYPTKQI